ncbi:restriction endonuclease subunit S [Lachnospira eligens]|jgi:type I restriction enzyme S subunit|uniref:restriction endonuclease subunit S n=2 Tax=Lachnospira eligens TaxID=39485 RepID=UPI0018A09A14|nr:restriction endonuclease subunit S [Lachnospira eligens]
MDTKALRQKILDLAIRGKLVPQDPNDEPAGVLLESIREQKQQMLKEGKLKKKDIKNDTIIFKGEDNLHYEKFQDGTVKCIEDEIPFEVPEGWAWSRLVSLTAIITKGASPKWQGVDYTSSGTMFITSENVEVETLLLESPKFLPEKINKIQPRSILETHDILTNIVGASIGRTCEYTLVDSANTNQAVAIIRLIAVDMVSYVVKCLNSDYCVNLMFANQVNVARANLSLSSLANFLIPIPPLKEMYRIIAHLDCSLRHISGIQSSEDELRQLILFTKTKILDLAIRGQLVPQNPDDEPASVLLERIRAEKEELIKQGKIKLDKKESVIFKGDDNSYYEKIGNKVNCIDEEIPFELPEGWAFIRLKIAWELISGRDLSPSEYNDKNDGIPYITGASNFRNGHISLVRWTTVPQVITRRGDLLLTCKGTIGEIAHNNFGEAHIARQIMAIRNIYSLNVDFLALCIEYSMTKIKQAAKGLIPGISREDILNLVIPIPPIKEQENICNKLKVTFSAIEHIEKSLN